MDVVISYFGVIGVLCLGIMSPGPSFLLVARTSVAVSRVDGLFAAFGMAVGSTMFAVLTLLGLQAVLLSVPFLYVILKVLGGAYLVYLAVVIWRGAKKSGSFYKTQKCSANSSDSFKLALTTQLSNPKTAIFYASVFAALLPEDLPNSMVWVLVLVIFILESCWYSLVAFVLSSAAPRKVYLSMKSVIDRIASGIIGALGLKLIFDAKNAPVG